ncbi:MAG: hypothetical protein AAFU64_20040 [Bacteroidota bacterium]
MISLQLNLNQEKVTHLYLKEKYGLFMLTLYNTRKKEDDPDEPNVVELKLLQMSQVGSLHEEKDAISKKLHTGDEIEIQVLGETKPSLSDPPEESQKYLEKRRLERLIQDHKDRLIHLRKKLANK